MSFSDNQFAAITAAERATSILSVIGTTIVISTFLSSHSFRKPINRVVFYAAWGNILTNVATLISRTAIVQKEKGAVLCRFQAILIQWFMPADALWTFAMAFNVYLTFFHKYDAAKLKHLEWKYLVLCYGLPFIPSFAYFFITSDSKGPVYGSATLWCWVSVDWDILRIAVFYGPVWLVILLTFAIYARVGIDIARKRNMLRSFNKESNMMTDDRLNNLFEIHASKVVHVTSEAANDQAVNGQRQDGNSGNSSNNVDDNSNTAAFSAYSVTVAGGEAFPLPPSTTSTVGIASVKVSPTSLHRAPRTDISSAAFAYFKYAVLYFIALLVTWVPSTINRVYSLVYPNEAIFGLEFVSAFVLPLQGFWNSIIYIAVSWSTVMEFVAGFRAWKRSSSSPADDGATAVKLKQYFTKKNSENSGSRVGRRVSYDTESTTHFAKDAEEA